MTMCLGRLRKITPRQEHVLEAGPDGERTVYVKYKNSFELWSPPIPDTITLNTVLTTPVITTDGGKGPGVDFPTTASTVTLEGTCSPITAQIKVNGSVTGVTYTPGATTWSFSGALRSGFNLFSVTALDGASHESEAATIAVTRVKPSSMSLYVAGSTTVTLGSPITLRGSITPRPAGGTIVSFESRLPSGVVSNEIPESVGTGSTGAYTRVFYPTEASEGRDAWTIKATWPGDSLLFQAESAPVNVNVLKAQPTLLLTLSAASVPQNYDGLEATVEFAAPLPDTLAGLREGRTIQLYARRLTASFAPLSKTTNVDGKAAFTSTDFTLGGWTFDMAGTWQFRAFFAGNESFLTAASPPYDEPESVRLTVRTRRATPSSCSVNTTRRGGRRNTVRPRTACIARCGPGTGHGRHLLFPCACDGIAAGHYWPTQHPPKRKSVRRLRHGRVTRCALLRRRSILFSWTMAA